MFWPSSSSVASIAMIFSGMSSTISMLTGSLVFMRKGCQVSGVRYRISVSDNRHLTPILSATNPCAQNGEHLFRVYGLRQVIPSTGLDALFPITLHRFRGDRD